MGSTLPSLGCFFSSSVVPQITAVAGALVYERSSGLHRCVHEWRHCWPVASRAWISYISDGFRMKRCADAKWSDILDTEWSFLHVFSKFAIFVFHLFFFSA